MRCCTVHCKLVVVPSKRQKRKRKKVPHGVAFSLFLVWKCVVSVLWWGFRSLFDILVWVWFAHAHCTFMWCSYFGRCFHLKLQFLKNFKENVIHSELWTKSMFIPVAFFFFYFFIFCSITGQTGLKQKYVWAFGIHACINEHEQLFFI